MFRRSGYRFAAKNMRHSGVARAIAALLVALTAALSPAFAQSEWPQKPVRIVSALAAGGLSDTLARIVAQHFESAFGGKFFVENKPGGGGVIGATHVAEQPADGYTLGISGIGSHVIAPSLNVHVGFDPIKSFTHIAFLGGSPTMLVTPTSLGAADLKSFIALVRGRDGLPYASSGAGTHGHLIGELFARTAGIKLNHVPYRGANVAITDVIAGHVPAAFVTASSAAQHIRVGSLKALAVTSAERLEQFPEVPTFRELGYPDLVALTWFALAAPAGLPRDLATRLNAEAVRAMTSPAVRQQLDAEAVQTQTLSVDEFTAFVRAEIARWGPIAKSLGKPN